MHFADFRQGRGLSVSFFCWRAHTFGSSWELERNTSSSERVPDLRQRWAGITHCLFTVKQLTCICPNHNSMSLLSMAMCPYICLYVYIYIYILLASLCYYIPSPPAPPHIFHGVPQSQKPPLPGAKAVKLEICHRNCSKHFFGFDNSILEGPIAIYNSILQLQAGTWDIYFSFLA